MVGHEDPDIVEAFSPSLEFGRASRTCLCVKGSLASPLSTLVITEMPTVPAHVVPLSCCICASLGGWESLAELGAQAPTI